MKAASWGTTDKILRGLVERRAALGDFVLKVAFRFGGTPFEVAEQGFGALRQGSASGPQRLELGRFARVPEHPGHHAERFASDRTEQMLVRAVLGAGGIGVR